MQALLHLMLLAFFGGTLCGAGWKLSSLAVDALRSRYSEWRINRYRDRQLARLERIGQVTQRHVDECGKVFTSGSLDDIRKSVCVRPAGHDGRCLGQDLKAAVGADFSSDRSSYLVCGSSAEN